MGMRGGMLVNGQAKQSTISAVITRADGTVENLGTIAYWHRNPFKRALWHLSHRLAARIRGDNRHIPG